MNIDKDFAYMIRQLMLYRLQKYPDSGIYEDSKDVVEYLLYSIRDNPTYVFDYNNLREQIKGVPLKNLLDAQIGHDDKSVNLMCHMAFASSSELVDLIYFSVREPVAEHPTLNDCIGYLHLTLPRFGKDVESPFLSTLTPQGVGLNTIVGVDCDGVVEATTATINAPLLELYKRGPMPLDQVFNLYHKTVFAMTYALDNMLYDKQEQSLKFDKYFHDLAEKHNLTLPDVRWYKINLHEQPSHVVQ